MVDRTPPDYTEAPLESDERKELFQEYLTKSGLQMAITRGIIALYEEKDKPDEPTGYVARLLGYGVSTRREVAKIQNEIRAMRTEKAELVADNKQLSEFLAGALERRLEEQRLSLASEMEQELLGEGAEDAEYEYGELSDSTSEELEPEEDMGEYGGEDDIMYTISLELHHERKLSEEEARRNTLYPQIN